MTPITRYRDRADAGRRLASMLLGYKDAQPLVLGLPRGGVPVAEEIARALGAELDCWVVRKVGAPGQPELGMGAVAEGDEIVIDDEIVSLVRATAYEVSGIVAAELAEVDERCARFRGRRPRPIVAGRTVIVVDDGVATGGTARAALRAIKKRGPKRLVLAVPIASVSAVESLEREADAVVCARRVADLGAVGFWYEDFAPVPDGDVIAALEAARSEHAPAPKPSGGLVRPVRINGGGVLLDGDLAIPARARGLVLFAHGSGSSRSSSRNRRVAAVLQDAGFATLLFDLLTVEEEAADMRDASLRFDIELLAHRLVAATDWAERFEATRDLPIGYFGASTGAAAALEAAARRRRVFAVVSRGGRPDLAAELLEHVEAPTLLIVGGEDTDVLRMNRDALRKLGGAKDLRIVEGATHLFEEPGALEEVAGLAVAWFARHVPDRIAAAG